MSITNRRTLEQSSKEFSIAHAKAMALIAEETKTFDAEYQAIQSAIAAMRNKINFNF